MPSRRGRRHQLRRLRQQQPRARQGRHGAQKLAGFKKAVISERIIVIRNQSDTADGGVTVSRSMPTILTSQIDDSSWGSFCDKLNDALKPDTKIKKAMRIQAIASIAAFVPLFLFVGITVATESPMDGFGTKIFLMLFGVAIAGIILGAGVTARYIKNVNDGLRKACDEISKLHPGVSFEVHYDLQYIEVSMSNVNSGDTIKEDDNQSNDSLDYNSSGTIPTNVTDANIWEATLDIDTNKTYYYNVKTREVTWVKPLESAKVSVYEEDMDSGAVAV